MKYITEWKMKGRILLTLRVQIIVLYIFLICSPLANRYLIKTNLPGKTHRQPHIFLPIQSVLLEITTLRLNQIFSTHVCTVAPCTEGKEHTSETASDTQIFRKLGWLTLRSSN